MNDYDDNIPDKVRPIPGDPFWHVDNLNEEVLTIPNFLTIKECEQVSDFLFEHEQEILELIPPDKKPDTMSYFELVNYGQQGPPQSYQSGLLKKAWVYNILQYKDMGKLLLPKLKKILIDDGILDKYFIKKKNVDIRGWGNILRYGEGIVPHTHSTQGIYALEDRRTYFLCINIFIAGPKHIGTEYQYDSYSSPIVHENEHGAITFFSSFRKHSVPRNMTNTPRISLAFDIMNDPSFVGSMDKELWECIIK